MFFENRYRDNEPLTRIGTFPVYCTTIIVAILVVGLVVTALFGSAVAFAFFPELFWKHGQIWRAITYLGVSQLDFFTLFWVLFTYQFGRDCEEALGRARYLGFLLLMIGAPVGFASILWAGFGLSGALAGVSPLTMGLVVAYATIYPNVESFARIPMKFIAIGCVFLGAVGSVSHSDQMGLMTMLATCGLSFGYIRAMRAGAFEGFSVNRLFQRKPKFRVVPKPEAAPRRPAEASTPDDVDALLDKIAKNGMASLTPKERARLEQAREALMRKDQR